MSVDAGAKGQNKNDVGEMGLRYMQGMQGMHSLTFSGPRTRLGSFICK